MTSGPNEQDAFDERDIVTKLWIEPPTHALAREAMDEIAELRWQLSIARKERDTARATAKRLNRRAQEAESKVAKANRTTVDTWSSAERQKESAERDAGMEAVAKAAARSER